MLLLQSVDSQARRLQLQHTEELVVPQHVESSQMRDQTHVPASLAGGFLTTGPPGKSSFSFLNEAEIGSGLLTAFYGLRIYAYY